MSDSVRPIDSSTPSFPVPGILQARTLDWVAISFSNAWKWKVKVKSLSCVWLLTTPWTAAYQAPLSMGFSRQEYWSGVPLPSPSTILVSYISTKNKINPDLPKCPQIILPWNFLNHIQASNKIIFVSLMTFKFFSKFWFHGHWGKNGDQNKETTRDRARAQMTGLLSCKSVHEANSHDVALLLSLFLLYSI